MGDALCRAGTDRAPPVGSKIFTAEMEWSRAANYRDHRRDWVNWISSGCRNRILVHGSEFVTTRCDVASSAETTSAQIDRSRLKFQVAGRQPHVFAT